MDWNEMTNQELFAAVKEAYGIVIKDENDDDAAMLVVKKLVEMGYYVDMGVDKHGAQVQLDRLDNEWELNVESTRARTLPLAISRAALAAVEREEEK
ncbi:MAG: hypothetical protein ACYSW6_10240 [Planctomycetota bacterium]|jgi:hypothetical protein